MACTVKKIILSSLISMVVCTGFAQTIASKLAAAVQQIEADASLKHAIVSVCVVDASTGKPVYAHHAEMGVAPASSQKIFTSIAAFELLGASYRYTTKLGYNGMINQGILDGSLVVVGSGDPTFGSTRWKDTRAEAVLGKLVSEVKQAGIRQIQGFVAERAPAFSYSHQSIPDGWIWQDIGNYYGAGCDLLNWKENQYDLRLRSGNEVGDKVAVLSDEPFQNELKTAAKGSGDNAYIYLPVGGIALLKGTIPEGEKSFTISGASPDPGHVFIDDLSSALKQQQIAVVRPEVINDHGKEIHFFAVHQSPSLDSINYWFMRKSINLYGEALLKTIAVENAGFGSTDKGVEVLREFWSERGIEKSALKVVDGSGLSPQNRVTTDAQVKALLYAKTRPWFNSFFNSLPEYNGMKMKSGTIGGAKAFAGYHGHYAFSIVVNNFDGSASAVVQRMYKVLDVLK